MEPSNPSNILFFLLLLYLLNFNILRNLAVLLKIDSFFPSNKIYTKPLVI